MLTRKQLKRIGKDIRRHCAEKGYRRRSPWFNPLIAHDPVAAFAMAKILTQSIRFDHYVAVAPEGHVYGYFFELFGAEIRAVFVNYPPTGFHEIDDLSMLRDNPVLILEDDVISGVSLNLVVQGLLKYSPRTLSLYLGRPKQAQYPDRIPSRIEKVYLAEDFLLPSERDVNESEFLAFFQQKGIL